MALVPPLIVSGILIRFTDLEDALYALRAFRSALEHAEEEISRWVAKVAA